MISYHATIRSTLARLACVSRQQGQRDVISKHVERHSKTMPTDSTMPASVAATGQPLLTRTLTANSGSASVFNAVTRYIGMAQRKTKYGAVCQGLKKLPLVEPERRDIVNLVREEILKEPDEGIQRDPAVITEQRIKHEEAFLSKLAIMQKAFNEIVALQKRRTGGRRYASEFQLAYIDCRQVKELLAQWQANVQLLIDTYLELMVEQMEVEGLEGVRTEAGFVSVTDEPTGIIKDKEAYRKWCIENGYESKMQLWPSTTEAIIKERVLAGEPNPDGVEVFSYRKVSLRRN